MSVPRLRSNGIPRRHHSLLNRHHPPKFQQHSVISLPDASDDNPGTAPRAQARRLHSERESFRSSLVMHNVIIDGRRTTVRVEPVMWDTLRGIARQQKVTLNDLVSDINRRRTDSGLTSAIRVYVVIYLSGALRKALHGRLSQDHEIDPLRLM